MQQFQRFPNYLKSLYENKSDKLKSIYGSFEKFQECALSNGAYKDWIHSLRDRQLDRQQMNSVAHAMYQYGGVKREEIHRNLAMLCHQFNVELPAVEGCLTPEFWQQFFGNKKLTIYV